MMDFNTNELETLKKIEFTFSIYSDGTTKTLGYSRLREIIQNLENETGVSDSLATHGALPLVRKSECEASDSDKLTGEAEHGKLENRIDSESLRCYKYYDFECKIQCIYCENRQDREAKES
jgi:hypothetical protein